MLGAIVTAFFGGIGLHKFFTRNDAHKKQPIQVDWGMVELRGRRKWTTEKKTDLQEKFMQTSSEKEQAIYKRLIDELDKELRDLDRALSGSSENEQQYK